MKRPYENMANIRKLKIGLVCDDSLDKTDGVQQYVLTLGAWLTSKGHSVHYLTSTTHRTDIPNIHSLSRNVAVTFNNNRIGMPLPASTSKIKQLLAEENFDVIHVQMPYSPLLAGKIIKSASATTAVVGTFHVFPHSRLMSMGTKLLGIVVSRQLQRFNRMISVSSAAQDFSIKSFGIQSAVIPNMVDVLRFTSTVSRKKEGPVRIVFLGRLVSRKGCLYLLRAVNALKTKADIEVIIGGKGPLLPDLEKFVSTNKLKSIVTFVGYVSEKEKVDFLADADIAVFPSTGGESFGISLIESMAATPGVVIAGDNPGYRTVMEGAEQQIVNPSDIDQFANILTQYITDKQMRLEAHAWQLRHVKQYDIQVVCPQILDTYTEALQEVRK